MIHRARDLMKNFGGMEMRGSVPQWLYDTEKVSVQEKVLVICLMYYYLHNRAFNFHYACVELFSRCAQWIKPSKIQAYETEINEESLKKIFPEDTKRVSVVLSTKLEKEIEEQINVPDISEIDIESIAEKLYQEYFC